MSTIKALGLSLLCAASLLTQTRPAFEVASIKPNKSPDTGGARSNIDQRGVQVSIVKFSVRMLMGKAYNLPTLGDALNRIRSLPGWADAEYFDIEAKAEGNSSAADKRLMLQSLLEDRFKLHLHLETRQGPVFALVRTKPGSMGSQLKPHTDDAACTARRAQTNRGSTARTAAAIITAELERSACGRVIGGVIPDSNQVWSGGRRITMEALAASIAGMELFERPIVDRTGLTGSFDFTVIWHMQQQTLSSTPTSDPSGVSLADALRDQLGLKLVSQTGPIDILVVDRVEKPAAN